jgi:hypothetical protein
MRNAQVGMDKWVRSSRTGAISFEERSEPHGSKVPWVLEACSLSRAWHGDEGIAVGCDPICGIYGSV